MRIEAKRKSDKIYHLKMESLLMQTRRLLRRFDLKIRKGLGQHFLIDEEVLELIISAAELNPADTVMEIGPGLGTLTRELARRVGRVIAIELDNKLATALKQDLADFSCVTIINEDILRIDPDALLREQKTDFPRLQDGSISYKVVANIPYYITSLVLRHFLEASLKPKVVVLMVQKEVAEAIVAEPGKMSLMSVSTQFYGEPSIVGLVPTSSFFPAPEVDSAILKIRVYSQPQVPVADTVGFFRLVRAGFSAPRKQIGNSLSKGLELPKTEVLSLLGEANIRSKRRAETLTLCEWSRLWHIFNQMNKHVNS